MELRLGGPAHGIVTKNVHETLPGGSGDPGLVGTGLHGWWGPGGWLGGVGGGSV